MSNVAAFQEVVAANAQDVTYHRETGGVDCPCLTEEGYRDPIWHVEHPPGIANPDLAGPPWNGVNPPICNEEGKQSLVVTNAAVKGFVQPVQSGATRRLTSEDVIQMFGEIQQDDHIGIFPLEYGGVTFDFYTWSQSGDEYLLYDGRRFLVVSANKIPDPTGGGPHHWEVGLRLMKTERPS